MFFGTDVICQKVLISLFVFGLFFLSFIKYVTEL
jgi:hypothetical protein